MIKTRIFKFVGHIHNMQLCIEMISFINHENESILRWFYSFCEPRNFSRCPRSLVGVYSGGLGVWFMTFCCCLVEFGFSCFNHASIESWFANYSVLDILHFIQQFLLFHVSLRRVLMRVTHFVVLLMQELAFSRRTRMYCILFTSREDTHCT